MSKVTAVDQNVKLALFVRRQLFNWNLNLLFIISKLILVYSTVFRGKLLVAYRYPTLLFNIDILYLLTFYLVPFQYTAGHQFWNSIKDIWAKSDYQFFGEAFPVIFLNSRSVFLAFKPLDIILLRHFQTIVPSLSIFYWCCFCMQTYHI